MAKIRVLFRQSLKSESIISDFSHFYTKSLVALPDGTKRANLSGRFRVHLHRVENMIYYF